MSVIICTVVRVLYFFVNVSSFALDRNAKRLAMHMTDHHMLWLHGWAVSIFRLKQYRNHVDITLETKLMFKATWTFSHPI